MKKIKRILDPNKRKHTIECKDSKVKSEFKDRCDLNVVLKNLRKQNGGVLPQMNQDDPYHIDVSGIGSLQDVMNKMSKAEHAWNRIGGEIKKEFRNNPVEFIDFMNGVEKGNNLEKAEKLGLIKINKPLPKPAQPEGEGKDSPPGAE